MFMLESQKGSRKLDRPARKRGGAAGRRGISRELDCILVARDRAGQTIDAVAGRGPLTVRQAKRHLLPVLDPQTLLVTGANAAYRSFARNTALRTKPLIRAQASAPALARQARSTCRTCMPATGAYGNGSPASTAWPRATCRIIWAGAGHSTASESLLLSNWSVSLSNQSTAYDDSAFQ